MSLRLRCAHASLLGSLLHAPLQQDEAGDFAVLVSLENEGGGWIATVAASAGRANRRGVGSARPMGHQRGEPEAAPVGSLKLDRGGEMLGYR